MVKMKLIIFILYLLFSILLLLCYITKIEYYPNNIYEKVKEFDILQMNELNKLNCKYPLKEIHISSILVFLLCRDRLYATYYSIKYWLELKRTIILNIVILDHNTTYTPLLQFYELLSRYFNIKIHYLKEKQWKKAVDKEIPTIVKEYLNINKEIEYYILSDIDIILINIPSNILDFYATILFNCNVNVIGPSLMINDISPQFPDYKKVYQFETYHYIKTNHYDIIYKGNYFSIIQADIDTIFGMRKRNLKFARHCSKSYRTLPPYVAHHIDWYITTKSIPKSFIYYVNHTKNINHSGSAFNVSNSLNQPYYKNNTLKS